MKNERKSRFIQEMVVCAIMFVITSLILFTILIALAYVVNMADGNLASTSNENSSFDSIYIKDTVNILSTKAKEKIDDYSSNLDKKSKAQIVVMTVDSLNGVPVQEYSLDQFRKLGIGDKELNNGILILLSKTDEKVRIEIGYGLEGALPDSKAGQILDEVMLPALKKGQLEEGIMQGYFAIAKEVSKEYKTTLHGGSNGGGGVHVSWGE